MVVAIPPLAHRIFLSQSAQDFIEGVIMAQYRMRLSKFLSQSAQDFIEGPQGGPQ